MTDEHGPNGRFGTETAAEAMDRLAAQLDGVRRNPAGGAVEYARGGVAFAFSETGRLSFRLRAEVVDAALRTPDTSRSVRGSQWIVLAASFEDAFVIDRVAAWFESAWRLAGESISGGAALN